MLIMKSIVQSLTLNQLYEWEKTILLLYLPIWYSMNWPKDAGS